MVCKPSFWCGYMKRHGMNVGVLSNYGLEGAIGEHRTEFGAVPVFPKGVAPYSQDVLTVWHEFQSAVCTRPETRDHDFV